MPDPAAFARLVPGFDFLQGLVSGAGKALPAINQWIAPTLDPAELDKRIKDLRTVQYWLEQNAKLTAATIQALEVQRMTLATLKTMNLPLADIGASMRLPDAPAPEAAPEPAATTKAAPRRKPRAAAPASAPAAAGGADPMAWWGALTQQFGDLAAKALQDLPGAGTKSRAAAKAPAAEARTTKAPAARKAPARKARQ
jgi:hypothetical protein